MLGAHCPLTGNLGTPSSPLWKCGFVVPDIKPTLLPSGQTSRELVWDVFFLHILPHLEARSTNLSNVILTRLRLEMKEIEGEVKMGFYS
jgi:hypothetical protein